MRSGSLGARIFHAQNNYETRANAIRVLFRFDPVTMRQLAVFFDGHWHAAIQGSALRQLRALCRDDVVHTWYDEQEAMAAAGGDSAMLERVVRAYRWLCERYRDGSAIFVFGSGAGAISALRLVRLIAVAGLLRRSDKEDQMRFVMDRERGLEVGRDESLARFRERYSRTVRIRFLGLMGAGIPAAEMPSWLRDAAWITDGRLNPLISSAFQALAADDQTHLPVLWRYHLLPTKSVAQCWFGGSLEEWGGKQSKLSRPLVGLMRTATRHRLALRPGWSREVPRAQPFIPGHPVGWREIVLLANQRPYPLGMFVDSDLRDPIEERSSIAWPSNVGDRSTLPITRTEDELLRLNELSRLGEWQSTESATDLEARLLGPARGVLRDSLESAKAPAPVKPRRFLLARFQQGEGSQTSVRDVIDPFTPTWLEVQIGLPQWNWLGGGSSDADFPEPFFDHRSRGDELQILLSMRSRREPVQMKRLLLPSKGNSDSVRFTLGKLEKIFEARISVLYRNRLLQSALIRVANGKPIFQVDAGLAADFSHLKQREAADVSIVVNESEMTGGTALVVSGALANELQLPSDDATLRDLIDALAELAGDPRMNAQPLTHPEKVLRLRNLAIQGRGIYDFLKQALPERDRASSPPWPVSIQLVTAHSSDLHPLEFAYDYPAPASSGSVSICPHWSPTAPSAQGTSVGCFERCALSIPAKHVCPNGFWGAKKLIERHAFQSGTAGLGDDKGVARRKHLPLSGAAVLGVSEIVHNVDPKAAAMLLRVLNAVLECQPTEQVKSWDDLKRLVAMHAPPLIVLLPHVQYDGPPAGGLRLPRGVYMEIEKIIQRASEIGPPHVRRGDLGPLVMLLGCEAALKYSKTEDGIAFFQRAGAAVVLAPLATVAPSNVVNFVRDFARALRRALGSRAPRIGVALRDARRAELARGNVLALGIMGFGDGDWQLTRKQPK